MISGIVALTVDFSFLLNEFTRGKCAQPNKLILENINSFPCNRKIPTKRALVSTPCHFFSIISAHLRAASLFFDGADKISNAHFLLLSISTISGILIVISSAFCGGSLSRFLICCVSAETGFILPPIMKLFNSNIVLICEVLVKYFSKITSKLSTQQVSANSEYLPLVLPPS